MKYKSKKQYRLPYYNYASSGYYFVTLVAKNRHKYFSAINDGNVILTDIGEIIKQSWLYIPISSPFVILDEYVIMPNHVHGILLIDNPNEGLELKEKKFEIRKKSLSIVMRTFKASVTARARKEHPDIKLWQSRFYDSIIRNETHLQNVRKYIENNPLQWEENSKNPMSIMM